MSIDNDFVVPRLPVFLHMPCRADDVAVWWTVMTENHGDGVIGCDSSGVVTFVNAVAEDMTGWSGSEAVGLDVAEVFVRIDEDTRAVVPSPATGAYRGDRTPGARSSGLLLIGKGKREFPIESSVSPIISDGVVSGWVIVFRDVSAALAMAEQMTHSFEHDSLTGLPNRLLLKDRIDQAIATAPRHERQVAVLFLDLDGFKYINDSLGHPTGDKLLQSIAKRLVGCVRTSDTVSRQGGDEFVVLLTESRQWEDAVVVAERILKAVAQSHPIDNHDLHVTTSIGVSVYPDDGEDAETLIRNADIAMYQAKEKGRNSYQFFKPAMNVRAVERQSIESSLRSAVKNGEFVLRYQPKVDLQTGLITGAEALIRWNHPLRGELAPGMFVSIAEDSGLIRQIGRWVLREACEQARAWLDEGLPPISIAVNVSAVELSDETYVQRLYATLSETGMDPSNLELELTESVLMRHAHSAAIILQALRKTGIQVALDDFGTGYSSLSYLRDFPIDSLKIDRSFVDEVTSVVEDTSIVKAVISMARNLGLRVVAEGVENMDQLEFLRAQACDEAQGYFFSRPVDPDAFAELLRSGFGPGFTGSEGGTREDKVTGLSSTLTNR
jgi:diguanylate cyclase (GGDEF)-like protein/PAS domain S-box-containing protein